MWLNSHDPKWLNFKRPLTVGREPRISWWQNRRSSNTHVVIWIEEKDFAVILAKRSKYYLLKTAYCVTPHRRKTFKKEREKFWQAQNG